VRRGLGMRHTRWLVVILSVAATIVTASGSASAVTSGVFLDNLSVFGGPSADSISIACVGGRVKINGQDPQTGASGCRHIEQIYVRGGPGPDRISLIGVGSEDGFDGLGQVSIEGGPGDDIIDGSDSYDLLYGGSGYDVLRGGPRQDSFWPGPDGGEVNGGGGEFEQLHVEGGGRWIIGATAGRRFGEHPMVIPFRKIDGVSVVGGSGRDRIDTRRFRGIEVRLFGRKGADHLRAGHGYSELHGGPGADVLVGGAGADLLDGDRGRDLLKGRRGNDDLRGGPQVDDCRGGAGQDVRRNCE
jgi:Ca2+-binding RTX toxin-like protein